MCETSPDQLEDIVDEAGSVVAAESCVVKPQKLDQSVPSPRLVVDDVISSHVHVKLNPLHLLRQV